MALTALRSGNAEDIAKALAMLKGDEVGEVCDPPFGEEDDNFDHPRLWRTWDTGEWRTNFPPPPGFEGSEEGDWGIDGYCRELSEEELAALITAGIADPSEADAHVSLEEDEAERDDFFSQLTVRADGDALA